MPAPAQLAHRNVSSTNLPYVSNTSPTNTDPKFVTGSTDILTSISGFCSRRPGFATNVETTPTVFNNLKRLFTWDRNDGTFFIMACDVNVSGFAQVYKLQVGTDSSFVSIFTDTVGTPFDFVVSNNTIYFSNGNVAKKWTPAQGVTNWGIAAPSVPLGPGVTGSAWSITQPFSTAWVAIIDANGNVQTVKTTGNSGSMAPAWSTSPGSTTTDGTVVWTCCGTVGAWKPSTYFQTFSTISDANGNLQTVSTGGTTFASGANQPSWATSVGSTTTDGTLTWTCMGAAGRVAITGYQYVYCYNNSASGHVSSPSPASYSTGPILSNGVLSLNITPAASTDPQVDKIKIFRSTDSVAPGATAGTYFEIPNSPFPNTTTLRTDTAIDSTLNVSSLCPIPTFNDPPTAGKNPVYFAGRIWLFNGSKVVFSGLEEVLNGVPEESFPSGTAGNFWTFDQPVQAENVAGDNPNQTLGVFCGGRIYGLTGNTLDTFRRFLVSNKRGTRSVTCTASLGGMVAWLDSSNQIWLTDGNSLNEISIDIRADIASVTPANCSMTFHIAGAYHWFVFSSGTQLFIYDMDQEQWMPPWSFAAKYVFSGETSPGNYVLMASTGTKALQLNPNAFNDNGATYAPVIKTNLFSAVPDFGKRFAYIATGTYDEPSRTGLPWYWQVDANSGDLFRDVLAMTDDDPANASSNYVSILKDKTTPEIAWTRPNGTYLVQNVFGMGKQVCRWVSMQMKLQSRDFNDKLYDWFIAYAEKR